MLCSLVKLLTDKCKDDKVLLKSEIDPDRQYFSSVRRVRGKGERITFWDFLIYAYFVTQDRGGNCFVAIFSISDFYW